MIESRYAALHVSGCGRFSLGFNCQIAHHVDSLARGDMFQIDLGTPYGVDLSDGRTIELGNGSARPTEEDGRKGGPLLIVCTMVDVEDHLPAATGLNVVVIADRQHGAQIGQGETVCVSGVDMPRQGAEAFPVRRLAAWATTHTATGADGLAVASLKVGASDPPVRLRCRPHSYDMCPI